MPQVADQKIVGRSMTFDGRYVEIVRMRYDGKLPAGNDEEIAVNVGAAPNSPGVSYGFDSVENAKRFLTSNGIEEFAGATRNGDVEISNRRGLGLPEAMISWV